MAINEHPNQRLSLDLPDSFHQMIKDLETLLGFGTKNEVVRNALLFFYETAGSVSEGKQFGVFDPEKNQFQPVFGGPISALAQRRRSEKTATA